MDRFKESDEISEESPLLRSEQTKNRESALLEDFDDVLNTVGSDGRFQTILLYCLLCPIAIFVDPLLTMNIYFLMYIPNHWCHVPGRQNETEELWKNMTIPMEQGPDGDSQFSQCKMYELSSWGQFMNQSKEIVVDCQYGWDFDKTYYQSTLPIQYEWLCNKSNYVTQAFTLSTIGNTIGSLVLGHIGDKIGRKPITILSIVIAILFGGASLFLASNFSIFLALQFLSGLAFPSLITSVCLIASETCSPELRSWVFSLLCFSRVAGNTIFPLISWAIGSWFLIGIISNIPALLALPIVIIYLPESPRWLMSMGRMDEALALLMKIAKTNNKEVSSFKLQADMIRIKEHLRANEKHNQSIILGAWTLFSKKRLAKNTILLCTTWATIGLIFYGLNLNTLNMSGNPFVNHMLLIGLIELPSGWILKFLVENFGRRWTQSCLLLFSGIAFMCSVFLVIDQGTTLNVLICCFVSKFFIVICDLTTDLQASEIFPTPLRATGFSLAATMSSCMQILGPSLIFMGKSHVAVPYIILTCLSMVGAILSVFLPETFRKKLPQTIEEADNLGKHDKFFSFLPH